MSNKRSLCSRWFLLFTKCKKRPLLRLLFQVNSSYISLIQLIRVFQGSLWCFWKGRHRNYAFLLGRLLSSKIQVEKTPLAFMAKFLKTLQAENLMKNRNRHWTYKNEKELLFVKRKKIRVRLSSKYQLHNSSISSNLILY